MYWVYVLKSIKDNGLYVGLSSNIGKCLKDHNAGYVRSTKGRRPFVLIYKEECFTQKDARAREKFLKSGTGREFLHQLIDQ